jgi:N-acetylmuramoyl-L-alanine amidase
MKLRLGAAVLLLAYALAPAVAARTGTVSARALYTRTLERERQLRATETQATLKQFRSVVSAYDAIVRRFPGSGYSDNALWQGGNLALLAFERFGQTTDRQRAERLLTQLKADYPNSSLVSRVDATLAAVEEPASTPPGTRPRAVEPPVDNEIEQPAPTSGVKPAAEAQPGAPPAAPVMIREIKRVPFPEGMRVTIELDAETPFRAERLENPRRVFFDLKGTRPVASLLDATLRYDDAIVREIRLGRHPQTTTRIVFDMAGVESYSVFTLYNPYRLVIDFRPQMNTDNGPQTHTDNTDSRPQTHTDNTDSRPQKNTDNTDNRPQKDTDNTDNRPQKNTDKTDNRPQKNTEVHGRDEARATVGTRRSDTSRPKGPAAGEPGPAAEVVPSITPAPLPPPASATLRAEAVPEPPAKPATSRPVITSAPIPTLPSANSDGKFSLSRQLGLGVSRIVIDAGHGGHDPGAQSNGVSESELTLDVALRLSRLLEKQPGVDVVLTRDTDVFIPLEERTAIANREGADLFLSIHANASRNTKAHGVETYFLNFASNPAAEAVAARENSASGRAMHSLPDIVRAIALNNKIDESRDFAETVQRSMVRRLSPRNKQLRDLGVKQAPFVVLIGAAMPSVLAEIAFVTHKQEGQLLKGTAYRQQIAEALLDAVLRYQQSLKRPRAGIVGMGTR